MINNFDFEALTFGAVAVIPIIVAVIQAIKMVGMPNKFSPIASLAVGIIVAFLLRHETQDFSQTLLAGVIYGLGASGLYSGVKTTAHATTGANNNDNN
jgi:hypothetical protein